MVEKVAADDQTRDESFSVDHVLSTCPDFANEISALAELVYRAGHLLTLSPKGHCECAGEGVEYSWGAMKKHFRRNNKQTGDIFKKLVLESMSRRTLTPRTVRKFARVARGYKAAYRTGVANEFADNKRMTKTFKAHRNALDFAGNLIEELM